MGDRKSFLINPRLTSHCYNKLLMLADTDLMQRFGNNDPQRIAKAGDMPADLLEGRNGGCGLVVGVMQGSGTRKHLAQFPHDHLIGTVAELPVLLAQSCFT